MTTNEPKRPNLEAEPASSESQTYEPESPREWVMKFRQEHEDQKRLLPFRTKSVCVEFSVLDAYDALRFTGLLKQIYDAVWAVHGEGIFALLEEGDPFTTRFYEDDQLDLINDQFTEDIPSPEDLPF